MPIRPRSAAPYLQTVYRASVDMSPSISNLSEMPLGPSGKLPLVADCGGRVAMGIEDPQEVWGRGRFRCYAACPCTYYGHESCALNLGIIQE